MKNLTKIFITAVAVLSLNFCLVQAIAKEETSEWNYTPGIIMKNMDMNFGRVLVTKSYSGTVVLTPSGTRKSGGGAVLPLAKGTVAAAVFTVSGQIGYTYTITLPAAVTITDAANHTMTLNKFTSAPAITGIIDPGGSQVKVGATLNVNAGQAKGIYTNPTGVQVTINYN